MRASVAELWRYPVKSMAGEKLPASQLGIHRVAWPCFRACAGCCGAIGGRHRVPQRLNPTVSANRQVIRQSPLSKRIS